MSQVWDIDIDDSTAKLTLMALADFADDDGLCFPSYAVVAKKISKSKPTAIRAINKLIELGYVTKEPREQKNGGDSSNLFRINTSAGSACDNRGSACDNRGSACDNRGSACDNRGSACDNRGSACDTPIINLTTNEPSNNHHLTLTPLPPKQSLPDFIDPQLWQEYLAYKAERKEKLSKQGIKMKFSEWAKWVDEGIDVNACIREAMANEWQGVFKPKPDKSNNGRNVPNNPTTNPHGLNQGTLNTMRAFREFEAQLIANGQGHRVGGNYDNK